MKNYKVRVSVEMKVWVKVEAESPEDAIDKVTQMDEAEILKAPIEDISTIAVQRAFEDS